MPLEHHPLHREFPELNSQLERLLATDGHFSHLAGEYAALDKRIYEVESGREALDSLVLQGLKMQRVALKDEIEELLHKAG
ncbi:YdcH family protein [Pseudomonas sp. TTU2014-080ASC]|uniref:YdcH family protein n=1 Tax=Pseudomonas sp. TTU2014-080ASC TaxID=1729724 RepID=UPI00071840A1|nr:DUF465 domain-containing protein [Pseudomonas sp. TTU2014-080ASC]KRW62867.1 GTP-binding protein [Pseudomonas sp. TTU2014-080ASC]